MCRMFETPDKIGTGGSKQQKANAARCEYLNSNQLKTHVLSF